MKKRENKNKFLYNFLIQVMPKNDIGYPMCIYNRIKRYMVNPRESDDENMAVILKESGKNFKLSEIKRKDRKLQPKLCKEFEYITIYLSSFDNVKIIDL
jgi:hypothetical protein